jgi:multidrug resistance efflux pump
VLVISIVLVALSYLWVKSPMPSNFVGEVQSPIGLVSAPEESKLLEILVTPFQMVTNGQILARLSTTSEESLKANVAAARADLEIMRVRMLQDQERNDLSYAQYRTDLLLQRLDLVSARIRLRQAESEFERVKQLYEEKIVSAGVGVDVDGYEVALRDRDVVRAEVADRERVVSDLENALVTLRPPDKQNRESLVHDAIASAVAAQEQALRQSEGATSLRASLDGMVTRVYRRAGEQVGRAEPLFDLRGVQPESILGFIRQPISAEPKVGDTVEVRSRGRPVKIGMAKVLNVGAHLELFTQPLRVRGFDASLERGLPVRLSFPEGMDLHPGELVDLVPSSPP